MSTIRIRAVTLLAAVAGGLSACTPPVAQRVAPYPGFGQPPEQFYRDSIECESWAQATAGSAGDSTATGALGGAATGAVAGAALGAIAGAFFGEAATGAGLGAALGGASGGMQGAAGGAVAYDQRLLTAYGNCMAARGYVVNGSTILPPQQARRVAEEAAPKPVSTVEERLIRLRQLHSDALITDKEYRDRRRAILEDL